MSRSRAHRRSLAGMVLPPLLAASALGLVGATAVPLAIPDSHPRPGAREQSAAAAREGLPAAGLPLAALDPGIDAERVPSFGVPDRAPFADARVVSFYGYPGAPTMGILGAYEPEEAARRVAEFARRYEAEAPGPPVVGALHLIVAVAQPTPGPDGTYLARIDPATIERYRRAVAEQDLLLFLDVQVGWADPLLEVQQLEAHLLDPRVQLALDPEFATAARNAAPGEVIGTLTARDVNRVQDYLASLVASHGLPPKLLVLHQFMDHMLESPDAYEAHPGVEIAVDMDGFGGIPAKLSKYEVYSLSSYSERPAIKLFFEWDAPLLTPAELAALPRQPGLVIYQ